MRRKGKGISFSCKTEAVEKYLRGQGNQADIAGEYGIDASTFHEWIAKYEAMDPSGLNTPATNHRYAAEMKIAEVESYLRGEGSLTNGDRRG